MPISTQGMFGGPQGDVAFTDNERTKAQTGLTNAQAGMVPSQINHNNAMAELERAQASEIQAKRRDQEELAAISKEMMSKEGPPTSPEDVLQRLEKGATLAMGTGKFAAGTKMADEARKMREGMATIEEKKARTEKEKVEAHLKQAEDLHSYFAGINADDPMSWAVAKMAYHEEHPGMPTPKIFDVYDPDVIRNVQARSKDYRDNALRASQELDKKDLARHRKEVEDAKQQEIAVQKARLAVYRAAEENRAKNGGKEPPPAKTPSKDMISYADSLIKERFPDFSPTLLSDKGIETTAGFAIAAEAQQLIRGNPGWSATEAVSKAFAAAETRGDFKEITAEKKWWGGGGDKSHVYSRGGGDTPLPLPSDKSKLEVGKTYKNGKGQVGVWNGTSIEPLPDPKKPKSTPRTAVEEAHEEETP